MQLQGSQTEKNLLIAFAGESQARNRYTFYASEAKKAGYEQIAAIFQETDDSFDLGCHTAFGKMSAFCQILLGFGQGKMI